jgi:multimeric flavodoxin WrbA
MKIALINGSPKRKDSASGLILEKFKAFVTGDDQIISELHFYQPQITAEEVEQLIDCDALVFAFPLYVDAIPSHLLRCLRQLEWVFTALNGREIMVYAIVNCGFYESEHNELALEMMENWSKRAGLKWGQGLALGTGGMLNMLERIQPGQGPFKKLKTVFTQLANEILNRSSAKTIYFTAVFPRFLYKLAAEAGWRKEIKANGLKKKDLFLQIEMTTDLRSSGQKREQG